MNIHKNNYQHNTLLFLHIPKAGGTTLNNILEKNYNTQNIFRINGSFPAKSIEEFKNLTKVKKKEIKLINRHLSFGLHEFVPNSSTYITRLRYPVERIISFYYYILRNPSHYLYERVISQKMTFKEFVSSDISLALNNAQTRAIANIWQKEFNNDSEERNMLEIAKRNLNEHFSCVGLTEKFDETLLLLNKKIGLKKIFYFKANTTKNRPKKQQVSEEILNIIRQKNFLDIKLYKYAEAILNKSIAECPINFKLKLQIFKTLNYFYGKVYFSAKKVKDFLV